MGLREVRCLRRVYDKLYLCDDTCKGCIWRFLVVSIHSQLSKCSLIVFEAWRSIKNLRMETFLHNLVSLLC